MSLDKQTVLKIILLAKDGRAGLKEKNDVIKKQKTNKSYYTAATLV